MTLRNLTMLVMWLLLASCASGFEKFYTPAANADVILKSPTTLPPPKQPQLFAHSADVQADAHRLMQDGYVYLGNSSFYGPANRSNQAQALEQGKRVGAAVVLFKTQYMDTLSGVVPYTVANPPVVSTVNTSGTVSGYGAGGYTTGNYASSGTVTTPGGYSTYNIPYAVNRNTFYASYWAKQDVSKMRLGIRYDPLSDDLRRKLERNTGVVVAVVIRGTPAFQANILEGDVLLSINGEAIVDPQNFDRVVTRMAGKPAEIELIRGEQTRKISVTLGQNP